MRKQPNQAIIPINMEVPQGNSLCSYLKQPNISFFFFFFWKNRKVEQVLLAGAWYQWEWGGGGERE
jgi:hypothetical protein